MSNVSLGPTPFPELTHIMIGLESCSFLVRPTALLSAAPASHRKGMSPPPMSPTRLVPAGGGLHSHPMSQQKGPSPLPTHPPMSPQEGDFIPPTPHVLTGGAFPSPPCPPPPPPGVPTGWGLHPFCGAEHDDGRGRLLLGRWAWQGHVHQALPQRAQQVGRACHVQLYWGPGPAEPTLGL